MYGGSAKLGRGRGGAPPNRNIHSAFQPSSVQRPAAAPAGGRQSAGGGHRSRSSTSAAPAAVSTADEAFSLVRNNPLNFGMIIRLSPVLVEEIKRLEALGGAARIKFDSSANNPAGNVIDVGGKEFRFTWSQETGDLCDIYEERLSGDNGDGLLVESGGAWRKLNVQRELDETVKNRVKMRTVEAERKHKSRKAIVLEHGNPSMKTQMKALAAAEVNNVWRSYKQKKEPPFKKMKAEPSSAIPSKSGGKAGFSSSTPSKIRDSVSPLISTPEKSYVPLSPLRNNNLNKVHTNREGAALIQSFKGNASTSGIVQNKAGSNEILGNKPTDLQSLLTSLLMEKPHGMNLKALEKAVGETIPKSVKQIEPILKKIAVFQAPARYILKQDVELESFKKSVTESGSSPENNNHRREPTTAPESSFPLKADDVKEFEEQSHQISEPYEDLNTSEKIDIDNLSPDVLSDKNVSHNIEGPAVSSSRSGSDSDSESDSSDSESDSRSPVGSRSGSSSDSDSDASANSKQGSDEDVDIMSDDDKEPKQKLQLLDHELGYAHNMADEKDDGHGSDLVDIEKDLFEDNDEAGLHAINNNDDNHADETTNLLINRLQHQESEVHDHAKRVVSKNTSKRGSDEKLLDENDHVKRLKSANWGRSAISRSPDGPTKTSQALGDVYDHENVSNHEFIGNSTSDSPRPGPGSIDLNAQAKPPAEMDNIVRFSERGPQGNSVFSMQKDNKSNKERRAEDGPSKDRRPPKNSGGKHSASHQKKHGAIIEKIKEPELLSTSQNKDSPVDLLKSTLPNGCRPTLRRELSDLELGEFRENMHEEKRFERNNNSFKQLDNMPTSDCWNLDESKGKPIDMLNPPKRVIPEEHVDDFTRFNGKQSLSRSDHVKTGSQHNKGRYNEAGASTLNTDSQRKVNVDVPRNNEKQVASISTKDKKRHKSKDLGEKKKDFGMVNSRDSNGQKRRELDPCSDDSITSYTKYEKEEPEMKGPIRDLSQYNEYVQEYREKYDCYHTLNKILESYRNEFQTFGRELELAKGRDIDRYNKIVEQLMESYRQCGTKHKRLKKIFIVLHHELQHLKEMIRDFADKQTKG